MGIPTTLKKTGNSRAFSVPAGFIKAHDLENMKGFEMDWRDGSIVITPITGDDTSVEDALIHELFADFGPEHVQRDLLRGDRRGQEEF